jgi:AcrR family transcriptional regulator
VAIEAPQPRRRRDARDNDTLILDACVSLAAREGWGALRAPRVSEVTGLSTAPIRERFPDRGAIGAALWRERISEPFLDRLAAVVAATPRPEQGYVVDDPQAMLSAMEPFQDHDDVMRAAGELLIMARFDPQLAEAVKATCLSCSGNWLKPVPGQIPPAQAARNGFMLALSLGLLIIGRAGNTAPVRVDGLLPGILAALSAQTEPQPLPPERAAHLDLGAVFNTDDPAWDALLQATLDEVGTRGYDGATLEIIARSAGYSRGIIQNRYANKKEIVLDATRRMLAAAVLLNEDYARRIAETYGSGLADACLMREFMDPSRFLVRSIALEQIRLAWHDTQFAEAMAAEMASARQELGRAAGDEQTTSDTAWHFSLAVGQGTAILADVHPEAATLPYDVVTIPLQEITG